MDGHRRAQAVIDSGRRSDLTRFTLPHPRRPLSAQQERIARLLAQGYGLKAIAADPDVNLSLTGVDYHLREIAAKLGLEGAGELSARDCVMVWAFWMYLPHRPRLDED